MKMILKKSNGGSKKLELVDGGCGLGDLHLFILETSILAHFIVYYHTFLVLLSKIKLFLYFLSSRLSITNSFQFFFIHSFCT